MECPEKISGFVLHAMERFEDAMERFCTGVNDKRTAAVFFTDAAICSGQWRDVL